MVGDESCATLAQLAMRRIWGLLLEEARRLLADDRQGVLDLGITPVAAKVAMTPPPGPLGLFADPGTAPASRVMVSRSQVLKTSSGLMYETLAGVYSSLGFDVVADESFRDLVIARVVEPTSLLDVDRVLAEMGRRAVSARPGNGRCVALMRASTAIRSRPRASPGL